MANNLIIIGTDLDRTKFERKYRKLKADLEKEELDLKVKTTERDDAEQKLREANLALEEQLVKQREINKEVEKYQKQYDTLNEKIKNNESLTTEEYNRYQFLYGKLKGLYPQQEAITKETEKYNEAVNKATDKLEKAETSLKKQEKSVEEIRNKFKDFNEDIEQHNLDYVQSQLNNVSKSLNGIVKKVGKWALAVFGLRSAYMFVRNAINTIAGQDEQLSNDIQAIKVALAYTIEPLVRGIVNLAKQLVSYIAYIVKAWSGRDIFEKTKQNLASANKSAKELQKSSLSFDKFTKLNGGSLQNGGVGALSAPENIQPPAWIVWIAKNGNTVKSILLGIATAITAVQLGVGLLPALVTGAIVAIVSLLSNNFYKVKQWFQNLLNWIEGPFYQTIQKDWGFVGDIIVTAISSAISAVKSIFEDLIGGIRRIIHGIINMFKIDFKTGLRQAFGGIQDILEAPFNALIAIVNATIRGINRIAKTNIPQITWPSSRKSGGARAKGGIYYPTMPKLASGGIINMPGRGVAYHGATIGERGAEAVVPLTDTAQMELLGATIGKHVKFDANITLELEGRILARVMKEVQNNYNFMRNGG